MRIDIPAVLSFWIDPPTSIDDVGIGPDPLVLIVRVLGLKSCVPTPLEQRYRGSRQLKLYDGYSYQMKLTSTSETRIGLQKMGSLKANFWKPIEYGHCCDAMT